MATPNNTRPITPSVDKTTRRVALLLGLLVASSIGCATNTIGISSTAQVTENLSAIAATGDPNACLAEPEPGQLPPRELAKVSLPTYRIEPPDLLIVDAIRAVPKSPYTIRTQDVLQIIVGNAQPDQPIAGAYLVESNGLVNLGPSYGPVKVEGLTIDEAIDAITRHLRATVLQPLVSVSLQQPALTQQIVGERVVGPDGNVRLGVYGAVYVTGLTIEEATRAIEDKLSEYFSDVKVSVDVFGYNSKVFYLITEGAGFGDSVVRLPITGNDTVLDAIASIQGLTQVAGAKIWISRPAPHGVGCDQILPVDWNAITTAANTCTNYQILPGDRLFVSQDRIFALGSLIGKILNPIERIFGFGLLGAQTFRSTQTLGIFN